MSNPQLSSETLTDAGGVKVSGNPTDTELAAALAVLSLLIQPRKLQAPVKDREIAGGWKSYWRTIRQPLHPGIDAWRGSLRRM
ncbi:MAG: hypothetical protein CR980_02075 [Propionibacteriales bacterium]|nr:MAG: hypothetical protein CR980_02075 [Propionibacteriales bacterium]